MGSIKKSILHFKIIGYTKQELLSVSMTSFIHPDDRLKPILK
jgi:hypothetical protein